MDKVINNEPTISKILSGHLPRLRHREPELEEFEKNYPLINTFPIVDKSTFIGIEVEVENVGNSYDHSIYWDVTEDGSLRNQGREFVSIPLRAFRVETALTWLFSRGLPSRRVFSERTSVHIHMNVRTLTMSQLETFVLTYMVFEKAFYKFAGNNRDKGIFCVPLYDINLTENLSQRLHNRQLNWMKYTGLNLLPIWDRGTVELRHLPGTDDVKKILTWINFMLCMKRYALRNDPVKIKEIINNLNTHSEYVAFGMEVFGNDLLSVLMYDNFEKDISYCVTKIKYRSLLNAANAHYKGKGLPKAVQKVIAKNNNKISFDPLFGRLRPEPEWFNQEQPIAPEDDVEEEEPQRIGLRVPPMPPLQRWADIGLGFRNQDEFTDAQNTIERMLTNRIAVRPLQTRVRND